MSKPISARVYDLYGRFYDGFEFFFKRRISKAIRHLPISANDRVLDIGVGTGLSLEYYPTSAHVTGLDLSAGMLAQARKKLVEGKLRPNGRTQLIQGDALNLPFDTGAFDCVFMSHVVATVPDPYRAMHEAIRVCRDHGTIAVLNHFQSPYPVVGWVEAAIDPICRKLGWRCDLSLSDLLNPLGVENPRPAFGWTFQTVYLQKRGDRLVIANPQDAPAGSPAVEPAP